MGTVSLNMLIDFIEFYSVQLKKPFRKICRMAASLNKRKHREKHNRIVVEGWRLVREALLAKAKVLNIFYTDPALLDHIDTSSLPSNCLAQISEETMESLSNAVTPPGIVGMFKRPRQGEGGELKNGNTVQNPLTVLCDGLKDPTNLGMAYSYFMAKKWLLSGKKC